VNWQNALPTSTGFADRQIEPLLWRRLHQCYHQNQVDFFSWFGKAKKLFLVNLTQNLWDTHTHA